jgi:hypothetical protein
MAADMGMNVSGWRTPATFFPWLHVQHYIDCIDSTVYRVAVEMAQERLITQAKPCPSCGQPPADLFWFSVTRPEEAWDAGTGQVGFLTLCECCKLQVDFLVDEELTDMQAKQWRDHRALY